MEHRKEFLVSTISARKAVKTAGHTTTQTVEAVQEWVDSASEEDIIAMSNIAKYKEPSSASDTEFVVEVPENVTSETLTVDTTKNGVVTGTADVPVYHLAYSSYDPQVRERNDGTGEFVSEDHRFAFGDTTIIVNSEALSLAVDKKVFTVGMTLPFKAESVGIKSYRHAKSGDLITYTEGKLLITACDVLKPYQAQIEKRAKTRVKLVSMRDNATNDISRDKIDNKVAEIETFGLDELAKELESLS